MVGVQVAYFGLFLILLQMCTMLFATSVFLIGVISMFATVEPDFGLKLWVWGGLSLVIAVLIGGLGKLLCLGAPEEGARKLIVCALACDLVGGVLRYLDSSGQFSFPFEGIVLWIIGLGSYAFFLAFLARMGDNVGAPQVRQYIGVIYGLFGTGFILPVMIFFSFKVGLLLLGLDVLVSLLLYTYTIYTLFRAMPLYIQEVKLGYTDPRESAEDRAKAERRERQNAGQGRGPAKAKPPEVPQGTPPVGAMLYRIPKDLSPLHFAVKEGDRNKMEQRLAMGDDPRATVRHGLSALHIAASCGVMEVADALIGFGVPVDGTCEEGLTPLFMAVQTGNPYVVGLLLNRGAYIHHANSHGYTPLHWACCAPHPNLEGATRIKMVETLLDHGADLQARTHDGKTPRDLAIDNQLNELIAFLDRREGKAPPPVVDHDSGSAEEASEATETAGYRPFLGTQLATIPSGLPELHAAVKDGDPEKVYRQLAFGVPIGEKVAGGLASIHITAITGVMSVSEMLLKHGADVNDTCDHGVTSLHLAIMVNNLNMVGFLLSRQADVNKADELGRTPLHWAAAVIHPKLEGQNRVKMVKFLLEKGADPQLKDVDGLTALDLATAAGQTEAVTALQAVAAPVSVANASAAEDDYY